MANVVCGIEGLEEEDLLYLDQYLNATGSISPGVEDFSNAWSPLGIPEVSSDSPPNEHVDKAINISSLNDVDISPMLEQLESSDSLEEFPQDVPPVRKTRGIPNERFVSYESFPPIKGKPVTCEVCGKNLASKESCKRHVLSQHTKERCHVCETCGKTFIFRFALKAHSAIHSDTPKYLCICGASYALRNSYMNHIQRIHRAAPERFRCELCFKTFGDRHTLRLHMISVHKPKTVKCNQEGCNKVFSSLSLMHCHYRYHQNRKFTCSKCGQSFSNKLYMKKHALTHSGIRPYVCVDCGKTYLTASHRNQHSRLCHSNTKIYQCSFCGKFFKTKDLLEYHEINHRGEKPFKCEVCGYATAYKNTYYAHRKKHLTEASSTLSSQKKSATKISKSFGIVNNTKSAETKLKPRKIYPMKKSKVNVWKDDKVFSNVHRQKQFSNMCGSSSSTSLILASPLSCSSSYSSVPIPSTSSTICLTKQAKLDLIVLSPNVISCPGPHVSESVIGSSVQLAVECVESDINLVTTYECDEQYAKDGNDLLATDCTVPQTSLETEKTDYSVLLSSDDRCATSDSLLLLVKTVDSSFDDLCTLNAASDKNKISELNLNATGNLSLAAVNSKCLDTNSGCNVLSMHPLASHLNSPGAISDDPKILMVSPLKSHEESLHDMNSVDHSAALLTECAQKPLADSVSLAFHQREELKPPSADAYLSEDLSPVSDIDDGIPSLSGHLVDDSLHLAQLEVICPLCDEQFFCMDTYITHLESTHN